MHTLRSALLIAIVAVVLGACADRPRGDMYGTVLLQTVSTSTGAYEISDRPDLGRLVIAAVEPERKGFELVTNTLRKALSIEPTPPTSAVFVSPVLEYFGQMQRKCRLITANPLADHRWEFVYNCTPGGDVSLPAWSSAGRSQSMLPSRVR